MWSDTCYMSLDVVSTMFPIINMAQNCLNGGLEGQLRNNIIKLTLISMVFIGKTGFNS